MKLCQFYLPGRGTRVGVLDGDHVVDITAARAGAASVRELIGSLGLACRILRDGKLLYEGRVNSKEMKRSCAELVEWLGRSNPVPAGTVLSTGTGILVPDEHALRAGDVVEIELERVGTLRNVVGRLP